MDATKIGMASSTRASETLKNKTAVIMKRWEERARNEVKSAYGSASLSMRDALPGHLNQLVDALALSEVESTEAIAKRTIKQKDVGKEHGSDRATTSSYSIDEVIFEYRILRQTIIEVLEEEVDLSGVEREIITDLIEQAVNDAATEFARSTKDLREQFTMTLTHDLRSPITAAKTSAQMIIRRSEKPELCVKNASRIIDHLARMDRMIEDLLDSGRIHDGVALSFQPSICDVNLLAQEVVDEMTTSYGERFLVSSNVTAHANWSVDLIRRALENLVVNAVKYGDARTPIKLILLENKSTVKMTVHNEGDPIPEGEMLEMFQKYRRSKSAIESTKKGWGLGLTLVTAVAKAHCGSVKVESSKGLGTSFIFEVPLDCRENQLQ